MPLEQTITVINNSGKIISTGKHLVNIFKDAKAAYQEKKASLRSDQLGIRRAQTFDLGPPQPRYEEYDHYDEPETYCEPRYIEDRRRSHDDGDGQSRASSRSQLSRHPHQIHHQHRDGGRRATRALTESNLRTLSEVSSTAPSERPAAYRSPYAETAPRDLALSRPTLAAPGRDYHAPPMPPTVVSSNDTRTIMSESHARDSMLVTRPRSDQSLRKRKSIDLNLAYGNIPPDLESRVDLDPTHKNSAKLQESEAHTLMGKIEGLLSEAQCLHYTATAIISHLQAKPEAAAAVALTLAELSTLLGKMSPAFLGVIKSGSPAIFALLASPQFLIGTGIAVGVTVVMFGGWKIVKKIQESKTRQEEPMAIPMMAQPATPLQASAHPPTPAEQAFVQGARFGGGASSFDEALVLGEELSTIESWRRGIAPFGEDETVDLELISPEAMRSAMADDAKTLRSTRTHRTNKTAKTHKSHQRSRGHHYREAEDVPERKSSKGFNGREDGERERDRARDRDVGSSDGRSEAGSHRSHRSSRSKKTDSRVQLKAIEDSTREDTDPISLDLSLQLKEKKVNMLKQLFKKKRGTERKERGTVSVLA